MPTIPVIELEYNDWGAIQDALRIIAEDLKASEEKRTRGRGFASGGKLGHYERLLRVRKIIQEEISKQDREQWLEQNPDLAKELEGLECSHEKCNGPVSITGCTRADYDGTITCPIRIAAEDADG